MGVPAPASGIWELSNALPGQVRCQENRQTQLVAVVGLALWGGRLTWRLLFQTNHVMSLSAQNGHWPELARSASVVANDPKQSYQRDWLSTWATADSDKYASF
jgi:hypothetical protein